MGTRAMQIRPAEPAENNDPVSAASGMNPKDRGYEGTSTRARRGEDEALAVTLAGLREPAWIRSPDEAGAGAGRRSVKSSLKVSAVDRFQPRQPKRRGGRGGRGVRGGREGGGDEEEGWTRRAERLWKD
ncbi:hypothetical protein AXG93_4192s1010 [Marchantia polymorpha subsp. ruderalis]|uniref:Uncharacterized protein n=1 Tax=Marchantia polymorpha subsp. ruderalis TaxID=1480154 RepID=A0A176VXG8_MARPO|nr:hypothetical protein AXG93_4192s1010 [Marchantia polymorpha subsp. ruderalis]